MSFKRFALSCALFVFSLPLFAKNVTNGSVNFALADTDKKVISLDGDWEFYANQTFTTLMGARLKVDFMEVPRSWSKRNADKPAIASLGCNTYRTMITGLRPNYEYAIFSRHSPNRSAMIYANGKFVVECGKFSRHEESYKPGQVPIYAKITSNENGFIELVVQVSNFTGGESGIMSPIYFGEGAAIEKLFLRVMLVTASIMGGLLFLFLMNISFWTFDKSRATNFFFAILILFMAARQYLLNFNSIGMIGIMPPFGLQFKLQNMLFFSGTLFGALYYYDKVFSAKHPTLDKTLSAVAFGMMIFFISLPDKISISFLNMAAICQLFFIIYAAYRIFLAAKTGQGTVAFYLLFFELLSIPMFIDYFTPTLWTNAHLHIFEMLLITMITIDIIYLAAALEILQKRSIALKNDSSKYHLSVRRFIPRYLSKVSDENIFKNLEVGSNIEDKMTIMAIGLKIISPDNSSLSLRDTFESMGFYTAAIIDQINKNNGAVISISNKGIFALFNSDSANAIDAAHDIRDLIQNVNARRAEDYYPCVAFNISIHQADTLLGIVGDRSRIDFSIISSGTEVADKMLNLGFAMNIPVLISEPTFHSLDGAVQNKLKLLGKIHFSEFARPIGLYGFISSEEEENRLETLDETPFITQVSADKYINF